MLCQGYAASTTLLLGHRLSDHDMYVVDLDVRTS